MAAITGLTTDWLAARLGVQPARVDALRRTGELVAVRRPDGAHVYPSWQFGEDGKPLPLVARLVGAARAAGIDDDRLHELVTRRMNGSGLAQVAVADSADELLRRLVWRAA